MLSTPADFPFLVKSLQFQPSPERSVVEGGGGRLPLFSDVIAVWKIGCRSSSGGGGGEGG